MVAVVAVVVGEDVLIVVVLSERDIEDVGELRWMLGVDVDVDVVQWG